MIGPPWHWKKETTWIVKPSVSWLTCCVLNFPEIRRLRVLWDLDVESSRKTKWLWGGLSCWIWAWQHRIEQKIQSWWEITNIKSSMAGDQSIIIVFTKKYYCHVVSKDRDHPHHSPYKNSFVLENYIISNTLKNSPVLFPFNYENHPLFIMYIVT